MRSLSTASLQVYGAGHRREVGSSEVTVGRSFTQKPLLQYFLLADEGVPCDVVTGHCGKQLKNKWISR